MRMTVLGSDGGYPLPGGGACSGYLFEAGPSRLWVDAGSGTLARLLERASLSDLDGILISHLHPDHWTDLPLAVHALRFAFERERPLPILGPPGWMEAMGTTLRWALADEVFEPREISDGLEWSFADIHVQALRVEHSDLETFGFRLAAAGAVASYSADTGPCDALHALASSTDLFLCEAGATAGQESAHHLNARQAGEVAAGADARLLLLTHLPPDGDPRRAVADAAAVFAGPVEIARVGTAYQFGR